MFSKISLHHLGENDCILYTAAVAYPIMAHDKRSMTIKRVGRDLITAEGIWLWKPDNQPMNDQVLITFDLPSNITISAPWDIVEDNREHTYLLGNTPYDWPAFVIFGFSKSLIHSRTTTSGIICVSSLAPFFI